MATRDLEFPFTLERSEDSGDGLTFEGYAAVFNSPTDIRDHNGEYQEVVAPGAFAKSIRERKPILMFDHGKHPMIGNIPIGRITAIPEKTRGGVYVKARLIDNPTINIVRDAIAAEAITGMSFRFEVIKDLWQGTGRARTRTLKEIKVPEVGPVVFPAYRDTTAAVRSTVRALEERFPDVVHVTVEGSNGRDIADRFVRAVRGNDDVEITTQESSVADLVADAIETLWGLSDQTSDAYIIDCFDDHAIFTIQGVADSKYSGLWQVNFTYTNGTVTISTPSRPPLAGYDTTIDTSQADGIDLPKTYGVNSATLKGTSHEAATGTSEEAATRSKEQILREIQLRERGILLPRKAS